MEGFRCATSRAEDQGPRHHRHPDFVSAHLERTTAEHQVLLDRNLPRSGRPISVVAALRGSSSEVLDSAWSALIKSAVLRRATIPDCGRVCGLRSATRTSPGAFWASWADCLHMVHQRHAPVAELLVRPLGRCSARRQGRWKVCKVSRSLRGALWPWDVDLLKTWTDPRSTPSRESPL